MQGQVEGLIPNSFVVQIPFRMLMRSLSSLLFVALTFVMMSCGPKVDMSNAGFATQTQLQQADQTVINESVGGNLDPAKLAPENGRFNHNGANYSMAEEGYYRWGRKLYEMGYRDHYYVQDLAPRAFKRKIMDIYLAALTAGFKDARDGVTN
jgi:hypothetical protein